MSLEEEPSTLLIQYDGSSPPAAEVKSALEKGDVPTKIATMKRMVKLQLNGESQAHHIMSVIKYCVPEESHTLKKILIYFWEAVEKVDDEGKLLPEMILLCSFLRNDLQHPNEYVRGVTLRFLSKLRERDILEPLISSVVPNLTHTFAFVRRNAVLAVHSIFSRFPQLMPDAPELIEEVFKMEKDLSTRRHAFIMLFHCAQERAVRCLALAREETSDGNVPAGAGGNDDVFQLAAVDHIRQLLAANPYEKPKYVPFLFAALQSKSPAVLFQCASTLLALASSPTAVKQAASTLTHLLVAHTDSTARLVVLDRLVEMRKAFAPALQENLQDIMRALASADAELRLRIVSLAVDLVNSKNIDGFVVTMKKELIRSQTDEVGDAVAQAAYRQAVIKALHTAVQRHLDAAPAVVPIMLDHICEPSAAAHDVVLFIRAVLLAKPQLQQDVLSKIAAMFGMIASAKVMRTVLWLFGVHCHSHVQVKFVVDQLLVALAPMPLSLPAEGAVADSGMPSPSAGSGPVATTTVGADGTYVMTMTPAQQQQDTKREGERSDLQGMRAHIVAGDFFLAAALASTLAKLAVNFVSSSHVSAAERNSLQADVTDALRELVRYGSAPTALHRTAPLDDDSHERIATALTIVQNPRHEFFGSMVQDTVSAFATMREKQQRDAEQAIADDEAAARGDKPVAADGEVTGLSDIDGALAFSQLSKGKAALFDFTAGDDVAAALADDGSAEDHDFAARLQRVTQLSGFSDPVYVEASVHVQMFDVTLEIYAVNQTALTLNNFSIELATTGDLKLCERPQTFILPPGASVTVKHSVKVGSTETGLIHGCALFDTDTSDGHSVVLNEIKVDIMHIIRPATCDMTDFRSMWSEFEWENKVTVSHDTMGLLEFIQYIQKLTNMRPLLPPTEEEADCGFLTVSLFAKSTFGEAALASVSLEKGEDGRVAGVARIRSKTQGIALGLGDKIGGKKK